MTQVYKHFKNTGSSVGGQTDLYDFTDLTKLMGFEEVWDFDKKTCRLTKIVTSASFGMQLFTLLGQRQ